MKNLYNLKQDYDCEVFNFMTLQENNTHIKLKKFMFGYPPIRDTPTQEFFLIFP